MSQVEGLNGEFHMGFIILLSYGLDSGVGSNPLLIDEGKLRLSILVSGPIKYGVSCSGLKSDKKGVLEINNSKLSVLDNGTRKMNELYWKKAVETWKVSVVLGLKFTEARNKWWSFWPRGFECKKKKKAVKNVVNKFKLDLLLIQESKLGMVDDWVTRSLWGNFMECFPFFAIVGSAETVISIGNDDFFHLNVIIVTHMYILSVGKIKALSLKCGLRNVYTPNDDRHMVVF
ncbi:hypothetical protein REPUB_Repub03eG0124500 [Reevesia pubescens]